MTTRTLRHGLLLGMAFAVLTGMAAPLPAAAQDYSPVVVVNDEIITGYDVAQRQRLLQAAGGSAVGEKEATEALIDDILRLQAARRAGIDPGKDAIDAGFAELSRNQGRDPEAMRRYFGAQGVSDRHLDNQMKAEIAWRELIPRTYMPRIRISDAEIGEVRETRDPAPTEPQYLLSEIRVPVGTGGEQAARAQASAVVQQLKGGAVTFGDLARQYSSGPTAATGGDLGWVGQSAMSDPMRRVVGAMSKDRVSNPFFDGNDITIVGVRDTRGPAGAIAANYRISQLVVGVAPDAAPGIASLALQQAQAARARVTDCASVEALKGEYLPISGDLGMMSADQMPPPVRNTVLSMSVGGVSEPIRSNDGFHVLVLCDKVETAAGAAAPATNDDEIRRQLLTSKLGRYSATLLRKLRREAVIERR